MPRDESKEKRAAKEAAKAPAAPAKPAVAPKGKGKAPVAAPEAAPAEEVREKKKEKISQKERPHSKKKHAKVKIWKLYQMKGNVLERKRENCPRCGPGTFLAAFKNRKYCGKCGFGEIKTVQ